MMTEQRETYADELLGFTLPGRSVRGRLVRLDKVVDAILKAHAYPAPITHLLGEALVLSALMGGLLKGENAQMTMQAQTQSGVVRLLVCDYRGGAMRGYVDFDKAALPGLGANPTLSALFGSGYLAITFEADNGTGAVERYQGIVPLEGDTLSQACENYFSQSEQVPTLLRVSSRSDASGSVAAGLLVQHLADGEEGRERLHVRMDHPDWEHVETLAGTISHDELLDEGLSLEAIIWRLFHEEEEIRTQPGYAVSNKCRCNPEHYESIIQRFPEDEQNEMRDEQGVIRVNCEFCSSEYELNI
jgi:molecular chaperone Hsp33